MILKLPEPDAFSTGDPAPAAIARPTAPLGVYVHVPFCIRKCPYCDFNSGPVREGTRRPHLEALEREIRRSPWRGCRGRTVYFGGGTPSELSGPELEALVTALRHTFALAEAAEWSIECNPGTVSLDSFRFMRGLGFNRVSLGVQSLHDRHLRFLGRIHDADEARKAYAWARTAGFHDVNLDLLFAIPGQTLVEWIRDLDEVLALGPDHLSLYNLTLEPNTEFGRRHARKELQEPDEELAAAQFEEALDRTAAAGYEHYEISSYARSGSKCLHNLIYWRNEPYLGFGLSAASYIDGRRWTNTGHYGKYAAAAPSGRVPRATEEALTGQAALAEEIMLRLRMREGFSLSDLSHRYETDAAALYRETLDFLTVQGLIEGDGDRVRLTRRGVLLATEVTAEFL